MRHWILGAAVLVAFHSSFAAKPMVALDEFHNNENPAKFTWNNLSNHAGYSTLAGILKGLGADTSSIHKAIDSVGLLSVNVLIVVDPDTEHTRLIGDAEILAINAWVQRGGSLVLLGNGVGSPVDCDYTHLNLLAGKFGIKFNGDDANATTFTLSPLPANQPFFVGATTLYAKGISTLTVSSPAQAVLTVSGKSIMGTSLMGKGKVFAMGDPWLYDEHIAANDNIAVGTKVMQWLLTPTTSIQDSRLRELLSHLPAGPGYLISGKRASPSTGSSWSQSVGIGVYHVPSAEAPTAP